MPQANSNGIDIYYEVTGSGRPILLISGLGYGLWMWHRMIPGLAEHFQVIAFDNRGAGKTDKPSGPYSVQMMAADTAGLLDALGVSGATVLGHSMGGFIAQELVLSRPDLVGELVLSATNFGGPNHIPVTQEAIAVMMDRSGDLVEVIRRGIAIACAPSFAKANPTIVQELIDYRLGNPVPLPQYQAQMAVGLNLLSAELCFESKLDEVQAPTLILFGEHDQVVPPANAELLAQKIANSTIQLLPDAGHMFPIETPDAATNAIIQWSER